MELLLHIKMGKNIYYEINTQFPQCKDKTYAIERK